jgi:cyclic pyranopterin phosphate synthase
MSSASKDPTSSAASASALSDGDEPASLPALSHLDAQGRAHMVAVSDKQETRREARASGRVIMQQTTLAQIVSGALPKGDVLQVARIAGISAVKRTADLIPLCHPLRITGVKLDFVPQPEKPDLQKPDLQPGECEIVISATVTAMDRTGVEMEALTAVAVAGLTIYDMCKAIDRGMRITDISLDEKSGGRSGHYVKPRL